MPDGKPEGRQAARGSSRRTSPVRCRYSRLSRRVHRRHLVGVEDQVAARPGRIDRGRRCVNSRELGSAVCGARNVLRLARIAGEEGQRRHECGNRFL